MTQDAEQGDPDQVQVHNQLLFNLLASKQHLDVDELKRTVPLEISKHVPAGRGLVFTQDVRPEQVLLQLSRPLLVNPATLAPLLDRSLIPARNAASSSSSRLSSPQALSFVLARWKAAVSTTAAQSSYKTDFDHFARTMPETFDTVPLAWSMVDQRQRDQAFYRKLVDSLPDHSFQLLSAIRKRFLDDWNRVDSLRQKDASLLALPGHPDTIADVRAVTKHHFLWAWLCVNSRCVFLPLQLPSHADNFTLAPLLDMANHTPDPSLECKVRFTPDGGLELSAPTRASRPADAGNRGLRKGDECFITYGAHSNAVLLSEYGFVLPNRVEHDGEWTGNRFCEVNVDNEIELMLKEQGAEGERKIQLLQDNGYWRDYTLHPSPEPAHPSHRLVPALRLWALDLSAPPQHVSKNAKLTKKSHPKSHKDPLEQWQATLSGYAEEVSAENERAAHDALVQLCDRVARSYIPKREELGAARDLLPSNSDDGSAKVSYNFVEQLLDEEEHIVRLVRAAAERGEEW